MNPIYAVHYRTSPNIGDRLCSPCHYFTFNRPVEFVDFGEWDCNGDAIIGGGGLFFAETEPRWRRIAASSAMRVVWGCGTNYRTGMTVPIYPACLRDLDIVGLRDCTAGMEIVPCASCMHEVFNRAFAQPTHYRAVVYHHAKERIPGTELMLSMDNECPDEQFSDLIHFLASSDVVVTNSYHGCYWAALLGRKVVCVGADSTRFRFFPFNVMHCSADAIGEAVELVLSKPAPVPILTWARERNVDFYEYVKRKIDL